LIGGIDMMIFYFLSVLAGILIIIATILNGKIAEKIGMSSGMKINYFVGAISSVVFIVLFKEAFTLEKIITGEIYIYIISGAAGAASLYILNKCVIEISAFHIVILPFMGQIITGMIMDYMAFDIFSLKKLIGGMIIIIGLIVYNGIGELKTN